MGLGGFDDDGSCGGGGEAPLWVTTQSMGVGGGLGGVDLDRVHFGAVDVGCDPEIEVALRADDGLIAFS
jgi:hypothetical protein